MSDNNSDDGDDLLDFLDAFQPVQEPSRPLPLAETDDEPEWREPQAPLLIAKKGARMPAVLAETLSLSPGQYHPRSDRHSVIKCLGLLFDLLELRPDLAQAIQEGRLTVGINTPVNGKALDLALGTPAIWNHQRPPRSLGDLAQAVGLDVNPFQNLLEGRIKMPLLAVEAKAIMTDHAGALPRLTDELERFRHRFGPETKAVGLVLVNVAQTFQSPLRNTQTHHRQPNDALKVVQAMFDLPLRVGMLFLDCPNDGSPITPRNLGPDHLTYEALLRELAQQVQ